MREDQALVLGSGDAEVGVGGLADAVDRATQDGDLHGLGVALEASLDLGDDGVHVELQAATGRAGDENRTALAELKRLEDLPGDLHLLLGVECGKADPDRVAHAVGEQRAEANGRLERAGPFRPGLGDPEVQRIRDLFREEPVGGDRVRHVGGLDRHLEVLEVERLHELAELDRGLNKGVDRLRALELVQVLGQRARVDADPHRHAGGGRPLSDLGHLLAPADVAGVQADAVGAGVDRLQCQGVVEVDVGDHRDRRLLDDHLEGVDVFLARDRHTHDVGPGVGHLGDLRHRRLEIGGFRLGHGLHGDRSAAADRHVLHPDLALGGHADIVTAGNLNLRRPGDVCSGQMRRNAGMRIALGVAVVGFAAWVMLGATAFASNHLIKIREVYPGEVAQPADEYVDLQMYAAGQNFFSAGTATKLYNATGTVTATFTTPS